MTLAASAGMIVVTAGVVTVVGLGALRLKDGRTDGVSELGSFKVFSAMRSFSTSHEGLLQFSQLVPSGIGRYQSISVLDEPTERARRKARTTYTLFGGAVTLPLLP